MKISIFILMTILMSLMGCHHDMASTKETIVFLRHGEKPEGGFGQMNCQGLNRSLVLPQVLNAKFGKPAVIFAPNPHDLADDGTRNHPAPYYYIRALAFIEPTAIRFNMPVNLDFGLYSGNDLIAKALLSPAYHHSLVLFAWEHQGIVEIIQAMFNQLGISAIKIPEWPSNDFDSLYIVTIDWAKNPVSVVFEHGFQHLNNQSKQCLNENRI